MDDVQNYQIICSTSRGEFQNKVNNLMGQGFRPLGAHTVSEYSKNEFCTTKVFCISMLKI